jgi:DNA-binding transcriptional ArsR family regulator
MALVDDTITVTLLASAAFFVALSFGLLLRYRQVSQKINASSDLGHDLWEALEQRMKKQDERILDMMGRLEVVQSRVMAAATAPAQVVPSPLPQPVSAATQAEEKPGIATESVPAMQQPESHLESQPQLQTSQESQAPVARAGLDDTQLAAIRLLSESSKNTRQLTDALKKSREHMARVMKELFELGLVKRDDSTKPFVYQLTDEGRRYLPSES